MESKISNSVIALVLHKQDLVSTNVTELKDRQLSQNFQAILLKNKSLWNHDLREEGSTLLAVLDDFTNLSVDKQRLNARKLAAKVVADLYASKTKEVQVVLSDLMTEEVVAAFLNSFILANYRYSIKSTNESGLTPDQPNYHRKIHNYTFSYKGETELRSNSTFNYWITLAEAVLIARTAGNTRGSVANPEYMEKETRKVLEQFKDSPVTLKVIKGQELVDQGMNLFYNVGKGALSEPRFIVVEYRGDQTQDQFHIAYVGKGITFDTGGINLKGSGSIEDMYWDKGGACSILGALQGTLQLQIKMNVIFAFAYAENSIGNASFLPCDILTSMKGLTVEIGNTDAEGRLVLADSFTYVQQNYKPQKMIDLATLTGAIRVALGQQHGGLFTNDEAFGNEFRLTGNEVFEENWWMPITDEAREIMKGTVSDLSNYKSHPYGGAVKAAAFLEYFVEKDTKWIHLDIAGVSATFGGNVKPPHCEGFNGFGAQSLIHYLAQQKIE
ncbi:UNKNOWN [Stylonychia lemnae]|uniref:Cytosol aminopeptidase domain-containing protein n=1 Tax=Stylonychia lemnae TaxID=5949 RepID=A0A078ALI0_STYLE|nr:UNKNOWN [Stylonychia lemnae]|eukprot:CDW82731.1 UNKNOWN [Stylonychia lemnae]